MSNDEFANELEAVLVAQVDVDENDVGAQFVNLRQYVGSGCRDADDFHLLGVQPRARGLEKPLVVVDDQAAQGHEHRVAAPPAHRIVANRSFETGPPRSKGWRPPVQTQASASAMLPSMEKDEFKTTSSKPSEHTTAVDEDTIDERRRVRAWRAEQLHRLGLSWLIAYTFASLVDWHDVAGLVEQGCSPQLALEIVR
jgi:hypothetical protein